MKIDSLLFVTVIVSIVILTAKAQKTGICEDGWVRFQDPFQNIVCVLVMKEPRVWKAAMEFCEGRLGKLMVLDYFGDLSYFKFNEERRISVGEEMATTHSVVDFWSGMFIEGGRLMWNDYGPKLVQRSKYTNIPSWRWGTNQPDPVAGHCGKASMNKLREINNVPIYDYQRAIVNLTQCETRLPFVCRKPPVQTNLKTVSFCPDNWVGNQNLPYCYRLYKEPARYEKASDLCTQDGGRIAPSRTEFDRNFALNAFRFYRANDEFFEARDIRNIWVENTANKSEQCSALGTTSQQTSTVREQNCSSLFLYMCVRPTQSASSTPIQTFSDYFDQKELLQYQPFHPLPVYGMLDRILQENDVIFVRTPSFILNSTDSYFQWRFENTPSWRVEDSSRLSAPYYANITLPFNQTPSRRRRSDGRKYFGIEGRIKKRQIFGEETTPSFNDETTPRFNDETTPRFNDERDDVFKFVNYENIRQTTGYYTFGLYNTNPPQYQEQKPQLVRYSDKDLYIFVAYCMFEESIIGPSSSEPFVTLEDVHAFNLLRDDSYIDMVQEMGISSILFQAPSLPGQEVAYYRAQIESIVNSEVKFRILLAPRTSRLQTISLEPLAYEAVKTHFESNLPSRYFKLSTLSVRSTVMCASSQVVENGKTLTFNAIKIGETGFSWERCYPNNKAYATSTCRGGYDDGATFREIKLAENCGEVPVYNESESTVTLRNLSQTVITETNYKTVLSNTANLTNPDVNLTEADIIYTAEILYNYLQFDTVNTLEVMETVFEIVNNVLRTGSDVIDTAQRITNAANRIILSVDDLTNNLALLGKSNAQFIQDLVVSEIWQQTGNENNVTIGISLDKTDNIEIKKDELSPVREPDNVEVPDTDTAIYLTKSLLEGKRTKLTFQIYGNTDLFSVISSKFKVNSKVAAARLTKNNRPIVDLGDDYVTAVFYTYKKSDNLVCAYWNYSANEDAGGWNTKGCTLVSNEYDRVVCKCNHLTNFAVLIDLEAGGISDTDKLVLGIITKIGLIISIIGLGITILTFLMFKHLRNGRGQQVLINLSVAMLCSSVLFLVGVDRTESYGGCIAVSAMLHYFILVTFLWMLVEGLLQYLRFVKVLGTYIPKFMFKTMIPAWGLPLIPVIIVLAIDYDMYYGGNGYCWLSWKPFLYAFIIPVAVIIFANIIVFLMVMCNLCCRRKHKGMVSNQSEKKMAFLHFQAGVSILVILGLTWVFGFLTVDNTRTVFHYLFAIFNAFQGFFIFLLFTAREKQIRKAWRKICCKKSQYKSTTSGTDSRPRKQSADNTNSTGLINKSNGNDSVHSNGDRHNGNGDHHFNNPQYKNGI